MKIAAIGSSPVTNGTASGATTGLGVTGESGWRSDCGGDRSRAMTTPSTITLTINAVTDRSDIRERTIEESEGSSTICTDTDAALVDRTSALLGGTHGTAKANGPILEVRLG